MSIVGKALPDQQSILRKVGLVLLPILIAAGILIFQVDLARGDGELSVEIVAGYNLVVDSNVSSPSTFGPEVATVMGKFCNNTTSTLENVFGYIGDSTTNTPGIYPVFNSNTLPIGHPLYDSGNYNFSHMGGRIGTDDATRFIGDLAPGECSVQYWHIVYPQCEGMTAPPCSGDPVWGLATDPTDDLKLRFDMWATSDTFDALPGQFTMTLRNEISAMANKIEPNPDGAWFNTKSSSVAPGEVITSNGVHYELGVVNKGFDNNNDGIYDFNAWMQPIGRQSFDPSCFRLIHTTGVLTITRSGGNPPMIVNFTDKLYFTNLPEDNTGVTGNVYYTFLALGGPCSIDLSPYQEAASGADNEKFNADFGTGVPPIVSEEPKVTIDKASSPAVVGTDTTYWYDISFSNIGTASAGLTLSSGGVNLPLVISDTVPEGIYYVGGSATCSIDGAPSCDAKILFSTNSGATWSETDPGTLQSTSGNKVILQWWLNNPLPAGSGGIARYQARTPSTPPSSPFIVNTACLSFDSGASFACDDVTTLIQGTLSIGDQVFRDENLDGVFNTGDSGIASVLLTLYWDRNNDNLLDEQDVLIYTTLSNASGVYGFNNLPNGEYLVAVSEDIPPVPIGYRHTTATVIPVTLAGSSVLTADFGFGPSLALTKILVDNPAYEGQMVRYVLNIQNLRPGGGEAVGPNTCRFKTWATAEASQTSGNATTKSWLNDTNMLGAAGPDGSYAYSDYTNALNQFAGTAFNVVPQSASISKVEAVFSLYIDGVALSNDNVSANLYFGNDATPLATKVFTVTRLNTYGLGQSQQGILSWDVTTANSWSWDDFSGNLDLMVETNKIGGKDGTTVYMDALGFYITTSAACPVADPADILLTVPLTDTYDTSLLTFLSAEPPVSSHNSTTGLLSWADVGPIYPGQTRSVQVVFQAKEPVPPTTSPTFNNTAGVTDATFPDNTKANNDYASASGTLIPTSSISGVVFSDVDSNSWPSGSSTGYNAPPDLFLSGVEVGLYQCVGMTSESTNKPCGGSGGNGGTWTLVYTTTTNASGQYTFPGLRNGYYYVDVGTHTIVGLSALSADPDDTDSPNRCTDNDCVATDSLWQHPAADIGNMKKLDYAVSGNIANINFGYTISPSVFGTVWQDHDNDGVRENGENGIPNVTVYLVNCGADNDCQTTVDNTTTTLTTNSEGEYSQTGLTAGRNYQVQVNTSTLPAGGTWIQVDDPDATLDNLYSFQGTAGKADGSNDFGYYRGGSYQIGDTVFTDWNGDGDQDTGEEGIPGVTVWLYEDSNGNGIIEPLTDALVGTTNTNSSGIYSFTGLPEGNYVVKVDESDLPNWDDFVQTKDPDQSGVCTNCNDTGSAAVSSSVPVNNDIDFGYKPTGFARLGDRVWRDSDADGIQDAGETGIPNITVRIYQDDDGDGVYDPAIDALVAETQTDSNGNYLFDVLPGIKYLVYVDTGDPDLPDDGYGNPYVLSTNNNYLSKQLAPGEEFLEADFGFSPGATLGDFIWQDSDGDGSQDPGEPGIPGVKVELCTDVNGNGVWDAGEPCQSTTTNASGIYTFTSIASGAYVVKVTPPPGGYTLTGDPDAPTVPCSGGGCNNEYSVHLEAGQVNLSADFGYRPAYSLGDFVWLDSNRDGVQDPGETGIGGVRLWLCSGSPTPCNGSTPGVISTVTDTDGYYTFGGLTNATYTVAVDTSTLPAGVTVQTFDHDSTLDNRTSIPVDGNLDIVDFGYYYDGEGSISGTVFFDKENNGGVYVSGTDLPLQNVTVYLYNNSGDLVNTTLTDAAGQYIFNNLPSGQVFTVVVNTQSPQIVGMTLTYEPQWTDADADQYCDANENCNNQAAIQTTASGQDFGLYAQMDCGDLPDSYNYKTALSKEGPCHIKDTLSPQILGDLWDRDYDGIPSQYANGDDTETITNDPEAQQDEDGVEPMNFSPDWDDGTTQSFTLDVNGTDAYGAGWFDWNKDGDFINTVGGVTTFDAGEYVYFGQLNNGLNTKSVFIPSGSACCSGTIKELFFRIRLYQGYSPPPVIAPTGIVFDGEVEDYRLFLDPTAITLLDFSASASPQRVLVAWETAAELNTFGYNVYRSSEQGGERMQINTALINSQGNGSSEGARYEFPDEQVEPGVRYLYWLEVVEEGGNSWIGPVSLTFPSDWLYLPVILR